MSAEIVNVSGGIVTIRFAGKLTESELAAVQKSAADLIRKQGKVRILALAEGFQGWERAGEWNDFSFQAEHDRNIERMAIVGDKRWEDLALIFAAQGLRKFPIEYFESAQIAAARAWLAE